MPRPNAGKPLIEVLGFERAYVGIDPGKQGGIAVLDENGTILLVLPLKPTTVETAA